MRRSRSICPSAEASKAIAQELAMLQKEEMEAQIGAMEGLEEVEEDTSLSSEEGGLKFASSRVQQCRTMFQLNLFRLFRFLLQGDVWRLKTI